MKALPLSDKIQKLAPDQPVSVIDNSGVEHRLRISSVRALEAGYGITFAGISSPEEARPLRGALIAVPREALALGPGEYWQDDILGMEAVTTEGVCLGKVVEILSTGSNDVYVVSGGGREYMLPAIRDVIVELRVDERKMVVRLMEGMLD